MPLRCPAPPRCARQENVGQAHADAGAPPPPPPPPPASPAARAARAAAGAALRGHLDAVLAGQALPPLLAVLDDALAAADDLAAVVEA
jgi:hypothetical protein